MQFEPSTESVKPGGELVIVTPSAAVTVQEPSWELLAFDPLLVDTYNQIPCVPANACVNVKLTVIVPVFPLNE